TGMSDVGDLLMQAQQLRLAVRAVFDSHDLQRSYLGLDDLFIRESYLWVANADIGGEVATGIYGVRAVASPAEARLSCVASVPVTPRLRDGLLLRWSAQPGGVLERPITG